MEARFITLIKEKTMLMPVASPQASQESGTGPLTHYRHLLCHLKLLTFKTADTILITYQLTWGLYTGP